jgi:hypothetical protein
LQVRVLSALPGGGAAKRMDGGVTTVGRPRKIFGEPELSAVPERATRDEQPTPVSRQTAQRFASEPR